MSKISKKSPEKAAMRADPSLKSLKEASMGPLEKS